MPNLPRLECDIENRSLAKQGEGPLTNVPWLRYTRRLNAAGDFETELPLRDERVSLVAEKTSVLRFFWNGAQVFVGVVEHTERVVSRDGALMLAVTGRCLGGAELSEATVDFLSLTSGASGVTDGPADILAAADTYIPTWSLDSAAGYTTTSTAVYAKFAGESALNALVKVAEKIGERFRFSTTDDRKLIWLRATTPSSGIRALQGAPNMVLAEGNPEICFFESFAEERDVHGLFTRIYPYGAGNVEIATKLLLTTRTSGGGFTLSAANNYIQSDAGVSAYGVIPKHVQFPDIRPISNTDADVISAANMLFDSARAMLERHDSVDDFIVFRLGGIVQLPSSVLAGTMLRVIYQDERYNVDEDLFVLEIESTIDQGGRQIHSLAVGAVDRLPAGEGEATSNGLEDGKLWQTHPIRNVNSYEMTVFKPIYHDGGVVDEAAYIYFDFDAEVVEVQQVRLKFETDGGGTVRMKPLESTVRSVAGSSTTTNSGGSSTPTSDSGGSSTPTSDSGGSSTPTSNSADPTHFHTLRIQNGTGANAVTMTDSAGNAAVYAPHGAGGGSDWASLSQAGGAMGHTHGVTIPSHTHGVTIPGHTHGVTIPSHTHTLTPVLTAVYGIFREDPANTFYLEDLRYQVNGVGVGDPFVLSGGGQNIFSLENNRYYLDITALVSTDGRPNQVSNVLEIWRISGATGGRVSCMIDGSLKIRTVIQSTAAS